MKKLSPKEALNKAYRRIQIDYKNYMDFINLIEEFISNTESGADSEGEQRDLFARFLTETHYKKNLITEVGSMDQAIRLDHSTKSDVAVIIEFKNISNKAEMPSLENLNTKAFQQLLLYYLRERIKGNTNIRHLIISNTRDFFIFDAKDFYNLFYKDSKLLADFKEFENKHLEDKNTPYFYEEIAAPAIERKIDKLTFCYFNLSDYKRDIKARKTTGRLPDLYRLFSPAHLLKQSFLNDSNSLDANFYKELLYIIGLEEKKQNNKYTIVRLPEDKRQKASLLENTISTLRCNYYDIPTTFGKNEEERLFNVALELCIVWINRLLFLKLVEAQLSNYHENNPNYKFLNFEKIPDFTALNNLFFQVMAIPPENRDEEFATNFRLVPYLNSSLFEISEIEKQFFTINKLDSASKIVPIRRSIITPLFNNKNYPEISFLKYLFSFLDSYNFSNEGSGEVADQPKILITASVLGLIFEKINGYKDGAVFTPGFITQTMCHSVIRNLVIAKINEKFNWNCKNLTDIINLNPDREKITEIIDNLKICDPAVGSGHFLVSALNEILLIKYELGCLELSNGKRILPSSYVFTIENDELIILDGNMDLWKYNSTTESRLFQQTIFNEKRKIIENSLFGVDINPNSVNICRLRLWIELLKNAYYTPESNYTKLETLPNIDINIKRGDSLLFKFPIEDDIIFPDILEYKRIVQDYKQSKDKYAKNKITSEINKIKGSASASFYENSQEMKDIKKLEKEIIDSSNIGLFDNVIKSKKEIKQLQKDIHKNITKIERLREKLKIIKETPRYNNGFEWRIEFPEILNDKGEFVGFDIIIGNPPYISLQDNKGALKKIYKNERYETFFAKGDIYCLFFELAYRLLKKDGALAFITSNTWLQSITFGPFRRFIANNFEWNKIIITDKSFKKVVDAHCIEFYKSQNRDDCDIFMQDNSNFYFSHTLDKNRIDLNGDPINISYSNEEARIIQKIVDNSIELNTLFQVYNGVKPFEKGKGNPPQTQEIVDNHTFVKEGEQPDETWSPLLRGNLIQKYRNLWDNNYWIKYGPWLAAPRDKSIFDAKEKIVVRQTGDSIIATMIDEKFICRDNLHICIPNDPKITKYVLGLLNSKVMDFIYTFINSEKGENLAQIKKAHVERLRLIIEKSFISIISDLVSRILKKESEDEDSSEAQKLIDLYSYHIYGLTYDEMRIFDSSTDIKREDYQILNFILSLYQHLYNLIPIL